MPNPNWSKSLCCCHIQKVITCLKTFPPLVAWRAIKEPTCEGWTEWDCKFLIVQQKCRTGTLPHHMQDWRSELQKKIAVAVFKVELTNLKIISPQTVRKLIWMLQPFSAFRVCQTTPQFVKKKPYLAGFWGMFLFEEIIQTTSSF